jgi:hypothetical protein
MKKLLLVPIVFIASTLAGIQSARATECPNMQGKGTGVSCLPQFSCGWLSTCVIVDCYSSKYACNPVQGFECNFTSCWLTDCSC